MNLLGEEEYVKTMNLAPVSEDPGMKENRIGEVVVDSAVKVHQALGPGLHEYVYELILERELKNRGFIVERQAPVPVEYEGIWFSEGFRADLLVEGRVILELKSVEKLNKVHHKQLFTYLKLRKLKVGFLLNFGVVQMKDGIFRINNGLDDEKG